MAILQALSVSRASAAALMSVGVLWGSFAGLVPDIKARVGASDAELGGTLLLSALSGLIAMSLAPWVTRRLGHRALPLLGLFVAFVILAPSFPTGLVGLGAAMLAMGFAVAMLDVTANVHISAAEARHGIHLMNVNHAMFSFAFAGAAWICGLARQAGWGPSDILPVMAVVCLGLALAMVSGPVPLGDDPAENTAAPSKGAPWLAIGLTGVILFAAFIGENATEAWSALHIERTLGAEAGHGSFGPALLGLVMGIGRMSGQVLTERFGDARMILGSAFLGVLGALTIAAAPSVPAVLLGVGLTGLGMAVVVPSVNSILGARVTEAQRAHAISRAWMLGIVGFFVGPSMMGGISEMVGLRWSFAAIAGIIALIVPAIVLLSTRVRPVSPARSTDTA